MALASVSNQTTSAPVGRSTSTSTWNRPPPAGNTYRARTWSTGTSMAQARERCPSRTATRRQKVPSSSAFSQIAARALPLTATAGALAEDGTGIALAWTPKTEKGLRISLPGLTEVLALDAKADVPSLDIASDTTFGEQRWLVAWTRTTKQQLATSAWAASMPDGNPFRLHDDANLDVTDVRFAVSDGFPCMALVTADEEVLVVRMTATGPKVLGRLGDPPGGAAPA